MADPVLYHIIETNYNGECTGSVLHLFNEEGEIVWSRFAEGMQLFNPHDELAEQLCVGSEAMGRHFAGELVAPES